MLASTLDVYSRLLCYPCPHSFLFPVAATKWWILGARCHPRRLLLLPRGCLLLHGDRRRPGGVRRSQAGGVASLIVASFVLAFLRQSCLTYVCTQILLLPLTLVSRAFVFEPSRPVACNIKLILFYMCLELCCDIFP